MGDAADDLENWEIERQLYPFGIDILFPHPVRDQNRKTLANQLWRKRSGEEICLKDVSLPHLLNIVKLLERKQFRYAPQVRDYYKYRATVERAEI